jgi:LacI family transcriptional regulator
VSNTSPRTRKRNQGRDSAATLQDVADAAKVSTATVSRCLNAPHRVTLELRQRVDAAIRQLGYVPHGAARALARQRADTIGAIFPAIDNLPFATAAKAIQDRLDPYGYTLLLANSADEDARELAQLRSLLTRGLDGVILVGEARCDDVYHLLATKAVPYVNTWTYNPDSPHPTLGFDNAEAARAVAQYLIDIGHRRIGMIAGPLARNDRVAARIEGVRTGLVANGLSLPDAVIEEAAYTISAGRTAVGRLRAAAPDLTALICGNDMLALGALFECQSQGLRVPQDLSITGFADLEISAEVFPPLTTVRVPAVEIGARAADYLLQVTTGGAPARATRLDAEIVVRGSSAPPGR